MVLTCCSQEEGMSGDIRSWEEGVKKGRIRCQFAVVTFHRGKLRRVIKVPIY